MKKVALVSGSSKGIGKAIAKELLGSEYIVYINGRDKANVESCVSELGGCAKPLIADLCVEDSVTSSLEYILNAEKRLDLLVCNIGSGRSVLGYDISLDEYKRVFDINFFSAVVLSTKAINSLKESHGNIIFISSIAGCEPLGAPIAYSCAKTALLAYSKNLAYEVAKYGIRVNSISPGNVMFGGSTWDDKIKVDKQKVLDYISSNVPLNTFVTPEDIARAVMFLEASEFVTGSNIIIDGGQTRKIV